MKGAPRDPTDPNLPGGEAEPLPLSLHPLPQPGSASSASSERSLVSLSREAEAGKAREAAGTSPESIAPDKGSILMHLTAIFIPALWEGT